MLELLKPTLELVEKIRAARRYVIEAWEGKDFGEAFERNLLLHELRNRLELDE